MPQELLKSFSDKKILVIGDIMLDHYVWGEVRRISPEAPVPVLEVKSEEYRPGGAANVALNLKALGAQPILLGILGDDNAADFLMQSLNNAGISGDNLLKSKDRKTSLKTRMNAVNQQILRIDQEDSSMIGSALEEQIKALCLKALPDADAVIIEDYNKGLLSEALIEAVILEANLAGLPVAVDPKNDNFFSYSKVDIFKPNYSELIAKLPAAPGTEDEFMAMAAELRSTMSIKHLVVTRGAMGLTIFSEDGRVHQLPTFAREVYDVTGAGDTVISVLSLAYACGRDILEAATLANHAAGVVCGKKGTATATIDEILASYQERDQYD